MRNQWAELMKWGTVKIPWNCFWLADSKQLLIPMVSHTYSNTGLLPPPSCPDVWNFSYLPYLGQMFIRAEWTDYMQNSRALS